MAGGQDIAFADVVGADCPDLKIEDGDLFADNGLENAVLLSLFTDRFVSREDLPDNTDTTRGWWGDSINTPVDDLIGSRLWVFDRIGKVDLDTKNKMKVAIEEALSWLVSDGIASQVLVTTELVTGEHINFTIEIFRPEEENNFFQFVWDGQELK